MLVHLHEFMEKAALYPNFILAVGMGGSDVPLLF